MRWMWVITVAGLTLFGARAARADRGPWSERPFGIAVQSGLGTPYGWMGVSADYAVAPWVVFEAGTGMGIAGPQAAGLVRLQWAHGIVAVGGGLGLSGGPYRGNKWSPFSDGPSTVGIAL